MAQPTGQVLLDAAHPYYGYLYYAHDTGGGGANDAGMWDARNGAMLAKTGAAGTVITEGSAKLFRSPGGATASVLSLPATLALTGAYTIIVRLRKNAGATDSAGVFFGAPSAGGHYMWFRTSEIRQGSVVQKTNTAVGTLATYMFTRSADGNSRSTYKDNDTGNTVTGFVAGLTIDRLMAGLNPESTYGANGAMEFFRIIPGLVPTPEQRTALFADPYVGLVAAADTTAPILSGASAGASSGTTATGGVTTNEAGPAWAVLTASSTTPTVAQIKAGQDHAGVAAAAADTGTLVVGANASAFGFTGLTPGATYYLHVTQDDAATPTPNTATPITSASITMPAPDVTPPTLSAPSAAATGTTTATGSVSTNEATGLLHYLASTDNTLIDTDDSGFWLAAHDAQAVTAVGVQAVSWSGLTPNTSYTTYFGHEDAAGNLSPVLKVESAFFTDALPSGTITITSPVPYQTAQRNVAANTASVTIAGTSTATTAIQYRRGTGAWQTLVASHAGGAYSATVTMPTGQGALQVRHASDNAVTASVPLPTVGDKFILGGQSNNVGVSPQLVAPVASAFTALQFDRADAWNPLQEGDTQATSFDGGSSGAKGSYVGALSNRLQAQGVPVAFIPTAAGSTQIISWTPAAGSLYNSMRTQWFQAGGGRALIFWQGESDATGGTTKADYKARLHAVIDGWWADTGTPTFLILITNFHANAPLIREAQMEVIAESAHVIGWADGGGAYSGDVHYLTAAQINAVADAIYTPFVQAFYTDEVALGAGPDAVAAADAGGAALFSYALGAGADSVAAVDAGGGIASGLLLGAGSDASAAVDAGGSALFSYALGAGADAVRLVDAGGSIGDGSAVWPAGRVGASHTFTVPASPVRLIVPPGDMDLINTPKIKQPADVEVYEIDFALLYLAGAADTADSLLALTAEPGVTVTSDPPAGSPVPSGVVRVRVSGGTSGSTYKVTARISTVGGREKEADLIVKVLEV